FLLPLSIDKPDKPDGGTYGGDLLLLSDGNVRVAYLHGTRGVRAVQLPAHGEVTVHGWPMQRWSEGNAPLSCEIRVADDIRIGDQPIASWFKQPTLSDAHANVQWGEPDELETRQTTNYTEVPLTTVNAQTMSVAFLP